ncbi:class I SAM-dependent methyltransferase [Enterococcus ratti]|uniref:Methyltransferase type 11 domain-containing protein n=1 Tax=Enterococcus ratti TaxID=150033 RepID=A0A1L8WNU2_9ENTE|nr:class I SAM-dependent methyltransferase [Enterococcus ratti]OJG82694.1 hypothetical protein RV14_GL002269 [Enterococcus ratti]
MKQMENLQQEIIEYWGKRSRTYAKQHKEELQASKKNRWQKFLFPKLVTSEKKIKKILDVGTGPGFMAILLSEAGYEVTAIDFTQEMLAEAKNNAGSYKDKINWLKMDAQDLVFEDQTFDAVITRNLTWNLENPVLAYQEWFRVLKKKGILINVDANWYRYLYDEQIYKKYKKDRLITKKYQIKDYYENTDIPMMEHIAREIPLSKEIRPNWDEEVLKKLGFEQVVTVTDINSLVLDKVEQINFSFSPLFFIQAVK